MVLGEVMDMDCLTVSLDHQIKAVALHARFPSSTTFINQGQLTADCP